MSATQFVINNIIEVLGGTGLIVTALATYLGKLLSDKALMREKAALELNLQKTKDDHLMSIKLLEKNLQLELAQKDQFHQISKTTFENIFNTKIDVYSNLLKLKTNYDNFRHENGSLEMYDPTDEILSHFNLFRKKIEENRLYISNDLSEKYDDWYLKAAPYLKEMDSVGITHQMLRDNLDATPDKQQRLDEEMYEEIQSIIYNLINSTTEKMDVLIRQIETDVKKIRSSVSIIKTI